MNTKITFALLFFGTTLLNSCSDSNIKREEKTNTSKKDAVESNQIASENEYEAGPPFSDTCKCSFDYIGRIQTNKDRYDLILSGKGWNPSYHSCTWTWGEIINNEFPPNKDIKDFRIHLVDLDKLDENIDSTFLDSELFNKNLIATYSKLPNEEYMTCKFDPNRTGKYPRPKQWTE